MPLFRVVIFSVFIGLVTPCCSVGWIAGRDSCYYVSTRNTTWAQASNVCQSMHSELVVIDSAEENKLLAGFIANFLPSFHHEFWIDGNDILIEGSFVWASTQQPMDYTNWSPNEPNDLNGEDCVELVQSSRKYTWNDAPCNTIQHYIYELPMMGLGGNPAQIVG